MPRSSGGRGGPDARAARRAQPAPPDPCAAAEALIAALGEQATCRATYQALKARQRGDRGAMEHWLRVAGATREILRSELEPQR